MEYSAVTAPGPVNVWSDYEGLTNLNYAIDAAAMTDPNITFY